MNGYISRKQSGTTGYLFKNAHGDVLAAYSSTTSKLADYTYDAWGKTRSETETSSFKNNPLRYCGEYLDSESGMTYLRARYYDSGIRRFITEDPIKDGANWYAYAGNNPIMFVDPSGLSDVPRDLDWDGDGFVDTKEDKARFDTNKNHVADWIEEGYSSAADWNAHKEKNILIGFQHVEQSYPNICWAAAFSAVIKNLTGRTIYDIRIAKDKFGEKEFNHGLSSSGQKDTIQKNGYFDNSRYIVDSRVYQVKDITKEKIKEKIDMGIPVILNYTAHAWVVIGYDFSNGKDEIIIDDPGHPYGTHIVTDKISAIRKLPNIDRNDRPTMILFNRIL